MPTLIRTLKHFTGTQNEPLHKVSEEVQAFNVGGVGGGQPLGGTPGPRAFEQGGKGTPPRQNSRSTDLDKTPPAEAKVLPWVEGVETGSIPDGMFGPYDTPAPSRMPTVHETVPEPRTRIPHPFAYGASASVPFSAIANAGSAQQDHEVPAVPTKDTATRESEVMSRGAGLRSMYHTPGAHGIIGSSRTEGGSPEGDGRRDHRRETDTRKAATSRGDSPIKGSPIRPVPTHGPPGEPLPPPPKTKTAASATTRKPVPLAPALPPQTNDHVAHDPPHLHRPHHDYPFSHRAAEQQQAAAVEQARAEALARLESARGEMPERTTGQVKGPRGTYDTATSGPSFGHINHRDGHPTSARQSFQPPLQEGGDGPASYPMTREGIAMGGGSFFRIPFGVPMGMSLPRPMMLMRTGTGAGMGLGIGNVGLGLRGAALEEVAEASEGSRKRDDRSAFVETVEDEQDPKTPRLTVRNPSLPSQPTGTQPEPTPARTESELNPHRMSEETPHPIYPAEPEQYPPQMSPHPAQHHKAQTHRSHAPSHTAKSARSHHHHTKSGTGRSAVNPDGTDQHRPQDRTATDATAKAPSIASDHRTLGEKTATYRHSHAAPPSIAPTSASNVKKLVQNSSFHDETLCELLEAARLNLIGPEAKKALQRAARARVIELKDIKEKGAGSAAYPSPPSSGEKRSRSKAKQSKLSESVTPAPAAVKDDSVAPQWAQQLTERMAELDARFIALAEHQEQALARKGHSALSPDGHQDDFDSVPQDLINDLIFHGLPSAAFTAGIQPFFQVDHPGMMPTTNDSPQSARIRAMTPSHKPRETSGDVTLTGGSEVELPSGIGSSPRKPDHAMGPTINVHPPTESNARTRLASIPSRTDPRTPVRTDIDLVEEHIVPGTGMADKSLPDTPDARGHSVRSTAPSPENARHIAEAEEMADYFSDKQPRTEKGMSAATTPTQRYHSQPMPTNIDTNGHSRHPTEPSALTLDAVTAPTHFTAHHDKKSAKNIIHVREASAPEQDLGPWDHVTQRLYAWALVWEDESFVKALESLALGKQVEVMPLTVFSMMTFKRLLNRNLTNIPPKACDKLFVPPIMAEAINKAVHNKQIDNARQILEELWYTWGFKAPPRVIIALAKHRNEPDKWTAHRFDLSTGHLTTYGVTSEQQNLPDGRPFMWWHAIRAAWPEYQIPEPERFKQRVEWVITSWEDKNDNSLKALNYARNLLLGFRPELARDLTKLRETVWEEVKRLLHKKRSGHLVVHVDPYDHEV